MLIYHYSVYKVKGKGSRSRERKKYLPKWNVMLD